MGDRGQWLSQFAVGLAGIAAATVLSACGGGTRAQVVPPGGAARGALLASSQTAALTQAQIDGVIAATPDEVPLVGGNAVCDVQLVRLVYETIGPHNESTQASAGMLVPSNCPGPYPVLLHMHGTKTLQTFSMSDPTQDYPVILTEYFGAQGYVVVMPDYHGYSGSTLGYHPYVQAENSAAVSIDALRAARAWLSAQSVATSGKLFLAGTSEGGHATMATQRTMERDFPTEFQITASVPMYGPYPLNQTMLDLLSQPNDPNNSSTVDATMALVGFQKTYGDVYAAPTDIFQSPYANGIESLLPGTHTGGQLISQGLLPFNLKGTPGLLTDTFVNAYLTNPNTPARLHADQNSLLNFKPVGPTTLCVGSLDPEPYANALTTQAYFATLGLSTPVVDIQTVPEFQSYINGRTNDGNNLNNYHSVVEQETCISYARHHVFDPLR